VTYQIGDRVEVLPRSDFIDPENHRGHGWIFDEGSMAGSWWVRLDSRHETLASEDDIRPPVAPAQSIDCHDWKPTRAQYALMAIGVVLGWCVLWFLSCALAA